MHINDFLLQRIIYGVSCVKIWNFLELVSEGVEVLKTEKSNAHAVT
jgi:hypothetical protein